VFAFAKGEHSILTIVIGNAIDMLRYFLVSTFTKPECGDLRIIS